ncbi:MAG: polysaccharide pyruvyl transferase family protein [Candidatus Peribacteraceae bacterium]|jgi:polysaccharide pyruvyl transferase WcaK-like protein/glycosyltransferase involved in cell wall biosynthesis|nr:polysaccharide pyruvyl transferase family protein [Candidatus Peribacteraceae bacterium]
MHITSVFHCPKSADARELGYNLAQYNLSLIEAMLERDPSLRVQIITSEQGQPLLLCPSLSSAVLSGALTIRPILKRTTLSLLSLAWRVRWASCVVVHFQHETYHYGGPLSIFVFPVLLGWLRLWTHSVVTLHHVMNPLRINASFAAFFATRLPPTIIRWGFTFFYRLVGWMASAIVVHEPCDLTILAEGYKLRAKKIIVIPHGAADCPRPPHFDRAAVLTRFGVPQDAAIIYGFFSYFDLTKGIDILIPAFLEHMRTHPKDALIVAGTYNPYHLQHKEMEETLRTVRAQADLEGNGRIIWAGFLSPSRETEFYRSVDCTVAPYRIFNGGSAAIAKSIGFRMPILLSDAFADCANPSFTFPLAPHALASALDAFAASAERRATLMEQIDAWRRERLWPMIGRKTLACYAALQRKQPATILLLGAYGQKNLGDELLLDACLQYLPRETCAVASTDPQETAASHGVRAVPGSLSLSLLRAFFHARTLVVGGGDQFKILKPTMGHSRHSLLLRETLLVAMARLLGKKVYFIGVGIGTLPTRWARMLSAIILRLTHLATFRDRESAETANMLAPHARIIESADLAFLQHSGATAPPVAAPTPQRLGIAPVFHLDHAKAFSTVVHALGAAMDGFLKADPARSALFLPFQTGGQNHHDIIMSGEILEHISEARRCSIAEHLNIGSVEQAYRSLDILWGMRLHSLILACLYRIPFIALIYDVKVRKFLEEIDCVQWGIPLDESFSAEKLLSLQRKLEAQLPQVRSHLHAQAEKLAIRARINAELLKKIGEEISETCLPDQPPVIIGKHSGSYPLAPAS